MNSPDGFDYKKSQTFLLSSVKNLSSIIIKHILHTLESLLSHHSTNPSTTNPKLQRHNDVPNLFRPRHREHSLLGRLRQPLVPRLSMRRKSLFQPIVALTSPNPPTLKWEHNTDGVLETLNRSNASSRPPSSSDAVMAMSSVPATIGALSSPSLLSSARSHALRTSHVSCLFC